MEYCYWNIILFIRVGDTSRRVSRSLDYRISTTADPIEFWVGPIDSLDPNYIIKAFLLFVAVFRMSEDITIQSPNWQITLKKRCYSRYHRRWLGEWEGEIYLSYFWHNTIVFASLALTYEHMFRCQCHFINSGKEIRIFDKLN